METEDILLYGAAAFAAIYITKGAGNLFSLAEKLPYYVQEETYNAAAGVTNQLGLTNTSMFLNEWGYGVATLSTSPTYPQNGFNWIMNLFR